MRFPRGDQANLVASMRCYNIQRCNMEPKLSSPSELAYPEMIRTICTDIADPLLYIPKQVPTESKFSRATHVERFARYSEQ